MNSRVGLILGGALIGATFVAGFCYFLLSGPKSPVPPVASNTPAAKAPAVMDSSAATADSTPSPQAPGGANSGLIYRYNAQGQVATITYPDGSVYTYQYDAYGDKIREINGAGKTWTYAYDQNHHPVAVIDPDGRVTRPASPAKPADTP